jgi:methylmalonyl-CoA mutase cobalamin-binding domain/chain
VVGGIVGKSAAERLRAMGVAGIYPPGSKLSAIVDGVRKAVADRRAA